MDRGRLGIRAGLWVDRHRRVDRAMDLFAVAPAAPREAQRHTSDPRLFRTARPRPRPAADIDFYRDGLCGTVDDARAVYPNAYHLVDPCKRDGRGPPPPMRGQISAAAGRCRGRICADRRRDPELSLHLGQAVHLLGDLWLCRSRGGVVARRSRGALCVDAESRGPGADGARHHLFAAEPGTDRRVDRRRAIRRLALGAHSAAASARSGISSPSCTSSAST